MHIAEEENRFSEWYCDCDCVRPVDLVGLSFQIGQTQQADREFKSPVRSNENLIPGNEEKSNKLTFTYTAVHQYEW